MIIKNGVVLDFDSGFKEKDIRIENQTIADITDTCSLDSVDGGQDIFDAGGLYVVPGFIDVHTHGVFGFDTMSASVEDFNKMSLFYASKGVTGFLPTTMTASLKEIGRVLENVASTIKNGTGGASILGIHVEGPFISKSHKGAHPEEYIVKASIEEIETMVQRSEGNIKIMTIAPEVEGMYEVLEHFKGRGISFSLGHSSLNYKQAMEVFGRGVCHTTHLFNAMTGIHHRDPGIAGAALDSENTRVEIIADGIHVDFAVIRMVAKCKQAGKMVLISDSTMAAGLERGEYMLGGQKIIVGDAARLENGVLAGSILTLSDAVRNMVNKVGVPLENAVEMASLAPAKAIGMEGRKGSIAVGKDADIAILDRSLDVKATVVGGRVVYRG